MYLRRILIGTVKTEYAKGLDMDDNYIYVADEVEGLITISMSIIKLEAINEVQTFFLQVIFQRDKV